MGNITPRVDLAFKKIFGVEENKDLLISLINSIVSKEDRDKFVKLVLEEFENLHEGNAIRFGVRPQEFAAWQKKIK